MVKMKSAAEAKRAVAAVAANLVEDGMTIGLGSGSTAVLFIEHLVERCRQGLSITAVATSLESEARARDGGIHVSELDAVRQIDLALDGADEIDPEKRMIKGGGGALLREKIVATAAKEMVVMVDESKLVDRLGTFGLPIEVVPFGHTFVLHKLKELGHQGHLRQSNGRYFVTDGGHYIIDISFNDLLSAPEEVDAQLRSITGVVDTGLFIGIAGRVLIGFEDSRVEVRS